MTYFHKYMWSTMTVMDVTDFLFTLPIWYLVTFSTFVCWTFRASSKQLCILWSLISFNRPRKSKIIAPHTRHVQWSDVNLYHLYHATYMDRKPTNTFISDSCILFCNTMIYYGSLLVLVWFKFMPQLDVDDVIFLYSLTLVVLYQAYLIYLNCYRYIYI